MISSVVEITVDQVEQTFMICVNKPRSEVIWEKDIGFSLQATTVSKEAKPVWDMHLYRLSFYEILETLTLLFSS